MIAMMYVKYPLSRINTENLRFARGIHFCHETVRAWSSQSGLTVADEVHCKRMISMALSTVASTLPHARHRRRDRAMPSIDWRLSRQLRTLAALRIGT